MQQHGGVARSRKALRMEVSRLRAELARERRRWEQIRVGSPLTRTHFWERLEGGSCDESNRWRWWLSWCPCCKRPLEISAFGGDPEDEKVCMEHIEEGEDGTGSIAEDDGEDTETSPCTRALPHVSPRRFAYAAAIWGSSPGFALGALVLGSALRRSGTEHDLALLHTDEVPASTLTLLAEVWSLHRVDHIEADSALFHLKGTRFDGVFTKLHVFGLCEYEKVLMLDLDLAVLRCPDELFDLPAPAALSRSVNGARPGALIDGRHWFAAEEPDEACARPSAARNM